VSALSQRTDASTPASREGHAPHGIVERERERERERESQVHRTGFSLILWLADGSVAGDVVALLHAGAYGLSYSPHGFLSHATPAEVMVDGGEARVVRERAKAADVLRGQRR
jgi:hypothetical protein